MKALLAYLEAGQQALERDDLAAAVTAFEQAQAMAPTSVPLAVALANVFRLLGDVLRARTVLTAAAETAAANGRGQPMTEVQALGAALLDVGAPHEAAACFALVMKAAPDDPAARAAMASALRAAGEAGRAWPLIQQALSRAPRNAAFLFTAAQIRHDLGDLRGAHTWLDAATAVRPNHAPTEMQRAFTTMLAGASEQGWRHFEARALPVPANGAAEWHGEPLDGSSILVAAEQGLGDQFQFVRFVALLAQRGPSRIVVECHADMVQLLRDNGLDAVPRGEAPATTWYVPIMSLPHRLGVHGHVHGELAPYLHATSGDGTAHPMARPTDGPHDRPSAARGNASTRRVGLVWAGNPAFLNRVRRDLDPAMLARIVAIPDIAWIAMQKEHDGTPLPHELHAAPPMPDWSATARVLADLDGLVTIDTGIAHLAGAMGVPTWILLPSSPDWRWGLGRDTTAWYPSVQLVRQPRAGDWAGAIERLAQQLSAWTRQRSAQQPIDGVGDAV